MPWGRWSQPWASECSTWLRPEWVITACPHLDWRLSYKDNDLDKIKQQKPALLWLNRAKGLNMLTVKPSLVSLPLNPRNLTEQSLETRGLI